MQTLQNRINSFVQEWEYYFFNDRDTKCKPIIQQFNKQIDELLQKNSTYKLSILILEQTKKQKALLYYLKGKVIDFLPTYDKSAQEYLNKSIKLNPVNGDCWNSLAHVLYKKKDYQGAQKAIEMALDNKGKNKTSLRYQSVLLRNQGSNPSQKSKNVQQAIKIVKQALMLDMKDPATWFFLGNAYMNNFFTNYKKVEQLENAIKAYNEAEKYFKFKYPDLFFNRAAAQSHLQNYQQAILDLKQADSIDLSLNSTQKIQALRNRLTYIKDCFQRVNEFKSQKIQQLVKNIPNSIKDQQNVQIVPLKSLKQRYNPKKMLSVKVLNKVTRDGDIPQSFLVIDSSGQFLCVSIYNINSNILNQKIKKDTLIQIKHPQLKTIKYEGFQYLSVQVFQLLNIWVNGSRLSRNQFQANIVVNKSVQN